MVKVTFSLDEETVAQIRRTATRLGRAQSQVVRDAVADYASRTDRLPEKERLRLLSVLDRLQVSASTRSGKSVDVELAAIRDARRAGGRKRSS
jgi:Arc/MetJ-type ribon-helix-helix transcriptional regulator